MGFLGAIGAKAVVAMIGTVAVASALAYGVHALKAWGASEFALEASQATLRAQSAEIANVRAQAVRNAASDAKALAAERSRSSELRERLAAVPAVQATEQCPASCFLPPSLLPPS